MGDAVARPVVPMPNRYAPPAPSADLVSVAIERAVRHRRRLAANDPRFAHVTAVALRERVVGLGAAPRPIRDGWWLVGRVVDGLVETEFLVWLHPTTGCVRTGARRLPNPEPPPPVRRADGRYYDGMRRRWVPADADASDPPVRP